MHVSYSLKGADLFVAQAYANKQHGVKGKYTVAIYVAACFLLPILLSALWPLRSVPRGTPLYHLRVWLPILLIGAMMFTFLRVFRRQKSSEYETVGNLSHTRTIQLQPDYIYSEDENSKSVTSWHGIINVVNGKDHILLFLSTKDAIILPKRCFASSHDAQKFWQTAASYWERARGIEIKAPLPDPRQS